MVQVLSVVVAPEAFPPATGTVTVKATLATVEELKAGIDTVLVALHLVFLTGVRAGRLVRLEAVAMAVPALKSRVQW